MYSPVVLGFCGALQENASRQLIDHVCVCVCETMRDWGERKTLIYTASASFLSTERMCSSSQAANYTHAIRRVSRGDRENAALSLSFFFGWVNVTSFLAVQVTSSISGFFFHAHITTPLKILYPMHDSWSRSRWWLPFFSITNGFILITKSITSIVSHYS